MTARFTAVLRTLTCGAALVVVLLSFAVTPAAHALTASVETTPAHDHRRGGWRHPLLRLGGDTGVG